MLAGVHLGCYNYSVRARPLDRDLKDKTVSVSQIGASSLLMSSMAAYVGLHPEKDINWIVRPPAESMQLLADGKGRCLWPFRPSRRSCVRSGSVRSGEHHS